MSLLVPDHLPPSETPLLDVTARQVLAMGPGELDNHGITGLTQFSDSVEVILHGGQHISLPIVPDRGEAIEPQAPPVTGLPYVEANGLAEFLLLPDATEPPVLGTLGQRIWAVEFAVQAGCNKTEDITLMAEGILAWVLAANA